MEANETLSYMRSCLDKKQVGSTTADRVSKIASFFMSSSFDQDDILHSISSYFPKNDELESWYLSNSRQVKKLSKESPNDYFSDRYDLEEDLSGYKNSSIWLNNVENGLKIMPLDPEVNEASMIVKILYKEALFAHEHKDELQSEILVDD